MEEFVSEPVVPWAGTFASAEMATGVPGLPRGFDWRGASYEVVERLESWKQSGHEAGRVSGELYLRRHYHRLRMSDGSVWTVYFVRQAPRRGPAAPRWFLYSTER